MKQQSEPSLKTIKTAGTDCAGTCTYTYIASYYTFRARWKHFPYEAKWSTYINSVLIIIYRVIKAWCWKSYNYILSLWRFSFNSPIVGNKYLACKESSLYTAYNNVIFEETKMESMIYYNVINTVASNDITEELSSSHYLHAYCWLHNLVPKY